MKFDDIEMAFYYVSSAQPFINHAYISRKTGDVYYTSELGDSDELPDDIDDASIYVSVPHKNHLNLGKRLVFEFVSEFLPDDYDQVSNIFRRKGAYSRFKRLLADRGKLDDWYSFEDERERRALLKWCEDNDIKIDS